MYGLVLEGGGSRGAYHIGACKALEERGMEISCVAGTSVGALNGAMIVQGDLDKAYELWYNIDPSKVIRFADDELEEMNMKTLRGNNFNTVIKHLKKIIVEKGLNIDPLIEIVSNYVDEKRVRNSKIDFGIVTFDLSDRKPVEIFKEEIPEGKLVDYLIASASLPGFKLKTIDGKVFIDGAVYNTLPVNLVIGKRCKNIIIIRTFGFGRTRKTDTTGLSVIHIAPSESLGTTLDFGNEKARKNLKLGYYDALRVLDKLKGSRYYIRPLNDDNFFVRYLAEFSDDKIRRMGELFGIHGCHSKRLLFEYIVPKIAELLGVSKDASYEDISIGLVENIAETSGVERFKIYTIFELLSEIAKVYKPAREGFIKEIPSFLRGLELVSKLTKDRILISIAGELFQDILNRG